MKNRFFVDEDGFKVALMEKGYEVLGRFLQSDVQSAEAADEVINRIKRSKKKKSEIVGNLYCIEIGEKFSHIFINETIDGEEQDDQGEQIIISNIELKEVISSWKDFLKNERKGMTH